MLKESFRLELRCPGDDASSLKLEVRVRVRVKSGISYFGAYLSFENSYLDSMVSILSR